MARQKEEKNTEQEQEINKNSSSESNQLQEEVDNGKKTKSKVESSEDQTNDDNKEKEDQKELVAKKLKKIKDKIQAKKTRKQSKSLKPAVIKKSKPFKFGSTQDFKTKADKKKKSKDKKEKRPKIENLPVIPIREGVLFPSTESVLTFGREKSLKAITRANKLNLPIVLLTQKKASVDNPKKEDLYQLGTLAMVERTLKTDDSVSALVKGVHRVKIDEFIQFKPFVKAKTTKVKNIIQRDDELKAISKHLQKSFKKIVQLGKPVEFLNFMKLISGVNEGELADQIASTLNIKTKQKQQILEETNVKKRIKLVLKYLLHEIKILQIEKDVVYKTQAKFDKHMKENILRERMKTIKKELGELEGEEDITETYLKKLSQSKMPQHIKSKVKKEIKRLSRMSINNPESGYIRSWLNTMFDMPWGKLNQTTIDLKKAKKILNESHYGLKDVKDRVLEYISVLKLKQEKQEENKDQKKKKKEKSSVEFGQQHPTILCFVGPPGVGKTSIGRAIAQSLNRKFTKISLGGIKDEAEIRGHRKTYVGAMPGRIIKGIKQAGSMNPVFILDEIDKIGNDFRGDPSSALLEVLDPEQNHSFEDHYLDVEFDLSNVIFITTANTLSTIPPALKDRLEVIEYNSYTYDEKYHITKQHLMDKVLEQHALTEKQIEIPDDIINKIIKRYTREAGVRELERTLGKIMRKTAREILEDRQEKQKKDQKKTIVIDEDKIKKYLGPEKYDITLKEEEDQIGLATGLAWTKLGGDVLFIEIALTPGKSKVKLTGKLGDVMKESAHAALTFVKSHAKEYDIDEDKLKKTDVHIHVPEGAVPKDGPSAGITITTAIVSAFTNRKVKKEVAMTGEITLRGRVLRIGGLKEKAIAAYLAGIETVIIPKKNKRDLVDIPEKIKDKIKFVPVDFANKAVDIALTK